MLRCVRKEGKVFFRRRLKNGMCVNFMLRKEQNPHYTFIYQVIAEDLLHAQSLLLMQYDV